MSSDTLQTPVRIDMNRVLVRRTVATLSGFAVAMTASLGFTPAQAVDPPSGSPVTSLVNSDGRGAPGTSRAAFASSARAARAADRSRSLDEPLTRPTSYPIQPTLETQPKTVPDSTDLNGTISYTDLAPALNDLMGRSNRISTEIVGRSTQGRDLYLVTLTLPETATATAQQEAWKDTIKNDPDAAAADPALLAGYKTPVWFSNNIHGNELEGTDASMQIIEELVEAPFGEVRDLLRDHRIYFSLSLNPDGRTIGQRATALGLDPNRDMITATTPEAQSFVRSVQAIQPLYAADLHGYTRVLQVEPTGPPHGENYEYDLSLPHNYALARQVEDDVVAANIPGNTYYNTATGTVVAENTGPDSAHIKIPYRDTPTGWDDFPPIFTAQYAAFFGAVSSTVELPKTRTGLTTTRADAVINTAVAKKTIESMIDYVATNSDAMLLNQIAMFDRGITGAPKDSLTMAEVAAVPGPAEWKPLWDVVDDQDPVQLPRAYVIPVGSTQRSMSDAAELVRRLLFNDIQVGTLDAATTVGGTTYPAGSYVVDLRQPLRGLANTLLDLGSDISPKVEEMYDISAWSYSYLWGADVAKVGSTTDAPLGATTPITAPTPVGAAPASAGFTTFDVAGVADFRALNALLEEGVTVSMLADGSAVVGPEAYADVVSAAEEFDVAFSRAGAADLDALDDPATKGLEDLTVGYTGALTSDDLLALSELGFDDLVQVTVPLLTTTPRLLDPVDVLWVGAGLNFTGQPVAQERVRAWVEDGGSIVGRGTGGFAAASTFGLVSGTAVAGNPSGSGIVSVDTPTDSPIAPYAQDFSFITPATWFTGLGAGTTVAQTYGATAAADPMLAGHWRAGVRQGVPLPGPESARGQAAVISGTATESGATAVVFGTSVFFRTHPKGMLSQAARAVFWAGPEGPELVAPGPGTTPTSPGVTSPGVGPVVGGPAASRVRLVVKRLGNARVRARIIVAAAAPVTGTVVVRDRGTKVRTFRLTPGDGTTTVRLRLGEGRHSLRAVYRGSPTVQPGRSAPRTVRLG